MSHIHTGITGQAVSEAIEITRKLYAAEIERLQAELKVAAGALEEAAKLLSPTMSGCAGIMRAHAQRAQDAAAVVTVGAEPDASA